MIRRRWALGAAGFLAIALSGPVGDLHALACEKLLDNFCGVPKDPSFWLDRALGLLTLVGGLILLSWALGAGRAAPAGARSALRWLYRLRWSPAVAAAVTAAFFAMTFDRPRSPTLLVDVAGPDGADVSLAAAGRWERSTRSRYREAFDDFLGLPRGGRYPEPAFEATQPHARFRLGNPPPSFEHWRTDWRGVALRVRGTSAKVSVSLVLAPCDGCGQTEHHVSRSTLAPCPGYVGEGQSCFLQTARFPRDASEVRITFDLAELK